LVGVLSGCSGCALGTQNLCTWLGQTMPLIAGGGEFYQCVPSKDAGTLINLAIGYYNASYFCPVDPDQAPIYTHDLWTATGPVPVEVASLYLNTYEEMEFADVDVEPWVVDRTSLYADHGALWTFGVNAGLFLANGDINRPYVDCNTLNDDEALDANIPGNVTGVCPITNHPLVDELVTGIIATENDVFCLKAIWGAYLSTRCPQYGVAVSGISFSLYLSFVDNCSPDALFADGPETFHRAVEIGPTFVTVPAGLGTVQVPYSIFGYPIVPDGTPFALEDITVPVSAEFEDWADLDLVTYESSYAASLFLEGNDSYGLAYDNAIVDEFCVD